MAKFILANRFNPQVDQFCVLLSISVPDEQINRFVDSVKTDGSVSNLLAVEGVKFDLHAVEMSYYLLCLYFLIVADAQKFDYVSWIQLVDAFCSSEKVGALYPIPSIDDSHAEQLEEYIKHILTIVFEDDKNKLPKQAADLLLSQQSISSAVTRLKKLGDSVYRGEFFSYCLFDLKQGITSDSVIKVFAPKFELLKIRSNSIKRLLSTSEPLIKWDYNLMENEVADQLLRIVDDILNCLKNVSQNVEYSNIATLSLCRNGVLEHVWMTSSRIQNAILDMTTDKTGNQNSKQLDFSVEM